MFCIGSFALILLNDAKPLSQVKEAIPGTLYPTSFPGFSPTRPTERERGWAGENPGNEVALYLLTDISHL